MFNINYYLPMLGCVIICIISFILSFDIIDFSEHNYIKEEKSKNVKVKYNKILIIVIISYALFFSVVQAGQDEGKLFIQDNLSKYFSVEQLALILSGMICISRITRVLANISFDKIYSKFKDKTSLILSVLLSTSIILLIGGYCLNISIILKIIIMTVGYAIILFVRDPFKVYIQNVGLNNAKKQQQQTFLIIMEMSRKISRAITSLIFTIIILQRPMFYIIVIIAILSIIEIVISYILLTIINNKNTDKIKNIEKQEELLGI